MAHSYLNHCEKLNSLCRLCGERVKRQIKDKHMHLKPCFDYAEELLSFYNFDVSRDEAGKHSNVMCRYCYLGLMSCKCKETTMATRIHRAKENLEECNYVWTKFESSTSPDECNVCCHFEKQCKGGRPKKPQRNSFKRKSSDETSSAADSSVVDDPSPGPSTSTPAKRHKVIDSPVLSPVVVFKTPPKPAVKDTATSPFEVQKQIRHPGTQTNKPLNKAENTFLTELVKTALTQSDDGVTVRCPTRGQPILLRKITKPRKSSSLAQSPLKRKRAKEMNRIRQDVSGGSGDDSMWQQSCEIKAKTKKAQDQILSAAGIPRASLSSKQGLALRTQTGMSFSIQILQAVNERRWSEI